MITKVELANSSKHNNDESRYDINSDTYLPPLLGSERNSEWNENVSRKIKWS